MGSRVAQLVERGAERSTLERDLKARRRAVMAEAAAAMRVAIEEARAWRGGESGLASFGL